MSLLALSPDGRFMAVASQDRTVRLYDLSTREQTAVLSGLRRPATALCFLGDGGFIATVCQENSVQLWDLQLREAAAVLWGPAGETFAGLALFGESNHLAAALADGRIREFVVLTLATAHMTRHPIFARRGSLLQWSFTRCGIRHHRRESRPSFT